MYGKKEGGKGTEGWRGGKAMGRVGKRGGKRKGVSEFDIGVTRWARGQDVGRDRKEI